MMPLKKGLLAVVAVLGLSTTLFYAACEKDSCTELKCKNGGSCADNFCRCPSGYEGAECEIKQSDRFTGKWGGSTRCSNETPDNPIGPNVNDTLFIFQSKTATSVGVVLKQNIRDTFYGVVSGRDINFNDVNNGNSRITRHIVLNDKNINYVIVNTRDVNNSRTQTECNFVGFGPIKP